MSPTTPNSSPVSQVSLVELIDKAGFEASIITTFNANLRFYEEFVLRRLQARNCRRNFVLMDARQCASTWVSEATRPRFAGTEYTLIPMHTAAAFHPKVLCLLGPKKAAIAVGSHNLTLSGFGINREITSVIEYAGNEFEAIPFIRDAWRDIQGWLEAELAFTPRDLMDPILELRRLLPAERINRSEGSAPIFISQSPGQEGLFVKLKSAVKFKPTFIAVLGAFFDSNLQFLKSIRDFWPTAKVVVGIDPATVWLPVIGDPEKFTYVDASQALRCSSDHYLHAKALYLEGETPEDCLWISGSANPSAQGWGIYQSNVEAGVLLRGLAARKVAEDLGVKGISELPGLSVEILKTAVARTKTNKDSNGDEHLTVLVGLASEDGLVVNVDLSSLKGVHSEPAGWESWSASLIGPFAQEKAVTVAVNGKYPLLALHLSMPLQGAAQLAIELSDGHICRILVHSCTNIKRHCSSSTQRQISDAIGSLDDSSADISAVMAVVTKVIFSESTEELLQITNHGARAHTSSVISKDTERSRPATLEETAPVRGEKKKRRMLSQGDLVELIDALKQKFYVRSPVKVERSADGTGGVDDGDGFVTEGEGAEEDMPKPPLPGLSDKEISLAVFAKARTLVSRMINREKSVAEQCAAREASGENVPIEPAMATVVQLLAVIGLLRELKRIENGPRWRGKDLKLVDSKSLLQLFEKSMEYLFRSDHNVATWAQGDHGNYAELDELYSLLAWLAWVCGLDFNAPVRPRYELGLEEHTRQLHANGYLARLMPLVIESQSIEEIRHGLENSIPKSPLARVQASSWLNRNFEYGQAMLDALTRATKTPARRELAEGDLAWLPGGPNQFVVIAEIDSGKLKLWDLGLNRGYLETYVRTFVP